MASKVVLITGCSSGFGYETSKLLALNGHRVYAGVRKEADLSILKDKNINTLLLDVTWSQEKISKVVEKIVLKEKRIDVLVNNSGFGFLGIISSFTAEEVKDQFETNFFGQFRMIKSVLPIMRNNKTGLIINISSTAGLVTTAFYGVYSASKFALEALTAALRSEESINNIKVVSVNPSSHKTKFWENLKFPKDDAFLNKVVRKVMPKIRHLRGESIAVAKKISKIIDTENPKKNYLVGMEAYFQFYGFKFIPQWLFDLIAKRIITRFSKMKINENN